jgi:hypothetical protein
MLPLVVINDLDIDWAGRSFGPFKANPPLVIDADAVLSLPVTIEGFKTDCPEARLDLSSCTLPQGAHGQVLNKSAINRQRLP